MFKFMAKCSNYLKSRIRVKAQCYYSFKEIKMYNWREILMTIPTSFRSIFNQLHSN